MSKKIPSDIIKVILINIDTGQEYKLFTEQYHRCYFTNWFELGKYEIRFKLDWGDIVNDEPMLDANLRDKVTGKEVRLKNKDFRHHTPRKFDPKTKERIYDFEILGFKMRLIAKKTVQKNLPSRAHVIRNEEKVQNS